MKYIIAVFCSFFFLVLLIIFRPWLQSNLFKVKPVYQIALLTRDATWANQVTEGISSAIEKCSVAEFKIKPFYAPGRDQLLLHNLVEEAVLSKPDLILSIGIIWTQIAVNVLKKRQYTVPLVFGAAGNPVTQGLVSAVDSRLEEVTGVLLGSEDNHIPVHLLIQSKPTLKKVLIPYFPTALSGDLERQAKEVRTLFAQYHIKAYLLPLENRSDVLALVAPFMKTVDTIMLLQGDTTGDYNSLLIKFCEQHGITFFGNELEAVQSGAALGFGFHSKNIGEMMFEYALKILTGKIKASELPVRTVDSMRFFALNKDAAVRQDLTVTDQLLALVDRVY